jgi:flagellar FliL protein
MDKEKKSAGFGKTLMVALVGLGVGAGGFWFYTQSVAKPAAALFSANAGQAEDATPALQYEPIFLEIEPFTVTLRNNMESRVVYTGMTLRVADENSKKRLVRYLPVVRSRILSELNNMNPSALNDRAEVNKLRERIKEAVAAPISPEPHPQRVDEVLLTSFMVQ